MTRAQTLGIMAAQLWARPDLRVYENPGDCLADADALLREAERVSPEPEPVHWYGPWPPDTALPAATSDFGQLDNRTEPTA